MTTIVNGTTGITFSDSSVQYTAAIGFRNRIINGGMVIDQRNAGASVTPTNGAYVIDRFQCILSQASKYSVQRSTTAPAGFINSMLITSLSAYSIVASDIFHVLQPIEGLNVADLAWGTADAQAVTLSFRVRSSLTGTFGGSLVNSAEDRSYPFSYTISAANTWETKTITVPGDTTGTWLTTNGIGIRCHFTIGVGSNYTATAGAWTAGAKFAPTGAVSVVGTNGATLYITGVQLEKATTASSFDFRSYGTELGLCQRYYEKTFPVDVAPANNAGSSGEVLFSSPQNGGGFGGNMYFNYFWKVTKRAAPTVTAFNTRATTANTWSTFDATVRADTAPVFENATTSGLSGYIQRGTLSAGAMTASAEL